MHSLVFKVFEFYQIWNGPTVSLNARLSDTVINEASFSSDFSWFSFTSNLHTTTPEPAS